MFRALVAKALYLSLDRTDIQQAVQVLTRVMDKPQRKHMSALKRLGRYLAGAPRLVYQFDWQPEVGAIDAYVDTDFAGCAVTRRSTIRQVMSSHLPLL